MAIASVSSPSSSRRRPTIPSTCAAKPKITPERIASTVDLPISARGAVRSIRGIAAARLVSASIEISTPGAMIPPTYSPAALTQS